LPDREDIARWHASSRDALQRLSVPLSHPRSLCPSGEGNDTGNVEGIVGYARRNFMVPIRQFLTWEAFNVWLEEQCRTARSWSVDKTYIKVKGKWTYLYWAVDRDGQTLDFMLSQRRDLAAARRFFKKAVTSNGVPQKVVIDKSGGNRAGLQAMNTILKFTGTGDIMKIRRLKYLNNILE
jgi:hypothetical protein